MKHHIYLLLLLMVVICLSGCGDTSIKKNVSKADLLEVIYPSVANIKNRSVQDNINSRLYMKSFEFLNENSILKGKANYNSIYNIAYNKHGIVSIRFMEVLFSPWNDETQARMKAITFNTKDGIIYSLGDLFLPGVDHKILLDKLIREVIKNNGIILLKEFEGIEKDQEFYLVDDGIIIYYQDSVYTSRRLGPFSVLIKYQKLNGSLRKDLGI